MVEDTKFCIESLVAACHSENPDDLWLEYQTNIPADTSLDDISAIKARFYNTVSDLLSFEEITDE